VKSLDYVQQPDGSFRWEMVEMDVAARATKTEPAPAKPARKAIKKATSEPVFVDPQPDTFDF
jgi:hypothetical protein